MKTLTASDRSALIRLASSLPKGSEERRAILEGLKEASKPIGKGKNGYIAMYKGKKVEVFADTSLKARDTAAAHFRARRPYDVTVTLAEQGGKQVTHAPLFASKGLQIGVPVSQIKVGKVASYKMELLTSVVDTRGLDKVKQNLRKAGDDQSYKLLMECVKYFLDRFDLSSGEEHALNRMAGLASKGANWDPSLVRNNVFKIANSLGMKLPSGMF